MRVLAYDAETLEQHWVTWVGVGVLLAVLGLVFISYATFATVASAVLFGALLAISGVIETFAAYRDRAGMHRAFFLMWGVLEIIVGVLMLSYPVQAALALTMLVTALLITSGVMRLMVAGSYPAPFRTWMLLAGVVNLALGFMVFGGWPATGLWFIGLCIGVSLLTNGIAIGLVAWQLHRHAPRRVPA